MSDSIVRLRVESEEFDNKIKKAAEALTLLAEKAHESGAILNVLEDENRDYITSIGQMATEARGAKASLNELKAAFIDMSAVYKKLSDEEKEGEFGKALGEQLEELKSRIQEGEGDLKSIGEEMSGTKEESDDLGSVMEAVASKFGLSAKALAGLGTAAGVTSAAMKVAKDAFFASEKNVDDFGRAVAAAKSGYEALLVSMNTGDVGGFLGKMGEVMNAATRAYNEVDKLSTQQRVDNARVEAQRVENERYRAMLQTSRYIAPNDGRAPEMAEGTVLTDEQKRVVEVKLQEGMATLNTIVREEIEQMTAAISALYEQQAAELGMSKEVFMAGTASMAEFQKMLTMAEKYRIFEAEHTTTVTTVSPTTGMSITTTQRDDAVNPYEDYKAWSVFKDDGQLFQQINQFITERVALQRTNIAMTREAYQSINAVEGVSPRAEDKRRVSSSVGGGISGGTVEPVVLGSVEALTMQLKELQELQEKVTDTEGWQLYEEQIREIAAQIQAIKDGGVVTLEGVSGFRAMLEADIANAEIGSTLQQTMSEQLKDVSIFEGLVKNMVEAGVTVADFDTAEVWRKIAGGEEVAVEVWKQTLEAVNAALKEKGLGPIKIEYTTGEVTEDSGEDSDGGKNEKKKEAKTPLGETKKLTEGLNSVAGGLQQMGVELPKEMDMALGLMNGFIQVIQGVGTILQVVTGGALAGNTAALLGLTAAVSANTATNIIPFKSGGIVPHFAGGGILRAAGGYMVPGHDYSDMTPIMVSSGELILNKAQQGNLASQFNDGGGVMKLTSKVRGSDLWMVLERTKREWGK